MDKSFTPQVLQQALERLSVSGINVKAICRELSDGNLTYYQKIQNKIRGKKSVLQEFMQPLIDRKPQLLTYLEEGEAAERESAASPAGGDDVAALLRDLKEGQSDLKRGLAAVAANVDYTRKYIELLENGVRLPPKPPESGGEGLTED